MSKLDIRSFVLGWLAALIGVAVAEGRWWMAAALIALWCAVTLPPVAAALVLGRKRGQTP